jgi:hypothetical protein
MMPWTLIAGLLVLVCVFALMINTVKFTFSVISALSLFAAGGKVDG